MFVPNNRSQFSFFVCSAYSSRYELKGVLNTQPTGFRCFLECFWLGIKSCVVFITWTHPHCSRSNTDRNISCIWIFSPHIAAAILRDRIWCSLCTYNIFLRIWFRHCKSSSRYSLWSRGRVGLWPLRSIHSVLFMCCHYARAYWYFLYVAQMHYAARLRVRSYSKVGLLYVRLPFTAKLILVQGSWSFPKRIGSFYHKEGLSPSTTACRIPLSVVCVPFRDGQVMATPNLVTPFCSCYLSSYSFFFWFSKRVFFFPHLARKRLAEQ